MSFLIFEIISCLVVAAIIGLFLGWWLRHLSAKSRETELADEWRGRVRASELKLAESAEKYTTLESQHKVVAADLETARTRQLELTTETNGLVGRVETLRQDLKERDEKVSAIGTERDALRSRLVASESALEVVRRDADAKRTDLEQELAGATEQAETSARRLESAEAKIVELTRELSSAHEKGEAVQGALDASAGRVTHLQREFDALSGKVVELETLLADSRRLLESGRQAFEQLRLDKDRELAETQRLAELRSQEKSTDRLALSEAEALVASLQSDRESTDQMLADLEEQLSIRDEDIGALRAELTSSERALSSLEAALDQSRQRSAALERGLRTREEELVKLKDLHEERGEMLHDTEAQLRSLQSSLDDLTMRSQELAIQQSNLSRKVEDRDRAIETLQNELQEKDELATGLNDTLSKRDDESNRWEGDLRKLNARIANLETEIEQRRQTISKLDDELVAARKRHAAYEATVEDLTLRNAELEDLLSEARRRGSAAQMISVDKSRTDGASPDRPDWLLEQPTRGQKDDLKKVKGIGPVLEEMLNTLGVFYFSQVAEFSTSDVEWISQQIDSFPDRIYRDRWIQQAAELNRTKQSETA